MKKRLCLLMLMIEGITTAFAYDFSSICSSGQTLYYNISGVSTATVTCPSNNSWSGFSMPSGNLIIPETVEHGGVTYTITSIGPYAFYYCTDLTVVSIPITVLTIGDYAFEHCTGLTELIIPDSVTEIGVWTFGYCDALPSVTIGSSVSIIHQNAFPSLFQSVISKNPIAPLWDGEPFQWNNEATPIFIPSGSLASYQERWWRFYNFIEVSDFSQNTPSSDTTCTLTFRLEDSYGDGWNNASLLVFQNYNQVTSISFDQGSHHETTMTFSSDSITLIWTPGFYDGECSFSIVSEDGIIQYERYGMNGVNGVVGKIGGFCPACSTPHELHLLDKGTDYLTLSWDGGPNSTYLVEYSPYLSDSVYKIHVVSDSLQINGLIPSTIYNVSIRRLCETGDSSNTLSERYITECDGTACLFSDTIGTGNETHQYLPSYSYYNYGYTQQIFKSEEIGHSGIITSLAFMMANVVQQRTYEIYLGHVYDSTLSSFITPEDLTLVYSGGHIPMIANQWTTFEFSTPFYYDGTRNLLVVFRDITGSWVQGNTGYVHYVSDAISRHVYRDGGEYYPGDVYGGQSYSYRNNIIIGGITNDIYSDSSNADNECYYTIELKSQNSVNGGSRGWLSVYHSSFHIGSFGLGSWTENNGYGCSGVFTNRWNTVSFVWHGGSNDNQDQVVIKDQWGATRYSGHVSVSSSYSTWSGEQSTSTLHLIDAQGNIKTVTDTTLFDLQCGDSSDIRHITINQTGPGTVSVNGTWDTSDWEYVHQGTVITIATTPNANATLQYLKVNGVEVPSPYTMTVTSDVNIEAVFYYNLPELHVTSLSCSDIVAGHDFSVSWTIQNDGNAATPVGTTWYDKLYLSTVPYLDYNSIDDAELLGTYENMSALDAGESYTRTITATMPLRHGSGSFYLILLSDANYAFNIEWPDDMMPTVYSPPPFLKAKSYYWSDYENVSEISEQGTYYYDGWNDETYLHDNFNFKTVQVTIPPLPDLEIANIVHPNNFYSGTQVSVTATVTNTGEAMTLSGGWRDALYISTSPTFSSSALQLTSVWHDASNALAPDSSYQVTFTGTIPLTWYGEAYFYVTTDCDDNEYEHIANDNNTSRSNAVNIILTPPADLVVNNVTVPAVASNQMPFSVSYTVTNAGLGVPDVNNWCDRVYLSTSPSLPTILLEYGGWYYDYSTWQDYSYNEIDESTEWCYIMETVNHTDGLAVGNSYTVNRSYSMPSFITRADTFYIIVVTDANSQVFEYQSEDNNTTASNASVISFFFPDLVVDTVIVPDSIDNNNEFTVSYTISNQGLGKAQSLWTDRISLSGNLLATATHYDPLMPGETYSESLTFSVQESFTWSGEQTITVTTDYYNDVDEKSAEDNNSHSVSTHVIVYKPDFSISDIQFPDTIVVNHSVDINFTLHNNGNKSFDGYLYYTFYYSTDSVLNLDWFYPTNAVWLANSQLYTFIGAGESQNVSQGLSFSSDLDDGNYYIHIIVDQQDWVLEENEQNNTTCTGSFRLCHRALPDLVLRNVSLPDTMQAGQVATLTFDVVNNGETTDVGPADIVASRCFSRLDAGEEWCPVESQVTPYPIGNITLALGDTLHYSQTVLIPPTISGNTNFSLRVDASNNIMELDESNNNVTVNCYVSPIQFDIDVSTIEAPATYSTGDTITVSWTVDMADATMLYNRSGHSHTDFTGYSGYLNWGQQMTGAYWSDRVYLSDNNTISDNDILLGSYNVTSIDGNSYTADIPAVMPHTMMGNLRLIVTSDADASIVENDRANNTMSAAINAVLAPMPNLQVTQFVMDDTVTQRQGCMIHYTVVNNGTGSVDNTVWTDKFYCGNVLLGQIAHNVSLVPGESYTDSVEVVIPSNLLGNYTLHATTDADNTVYEHDGESDNSLPRPVLVLQAPPCDLIVTNVEATATAVVGTAITVSWTVQNIGDNTVSGYVKDGIYLSHDTVFDNSDVLIGTISYYNSFEPYGSMQRTLNCAVQGVTSGNYYVLVRTNIMRAFNEVSFDNNTHASVSPTEVALPTLTIGQAEQLTMASGSQAYYRMVVGQEYAGQTLSLTLTTEVDNAFNGIYLSHESMPSAARSDYGSSVPYARTQQILVPVLQEGTYYLMASASTTNRAPQQITLLAEIIDFEILHLNTASGTNTGSVTTKVTGAKFDTIMDFRLVDASGYTPAQKVKFENSTQSFVTFNLTDLPAGTYHVEAELPGGVVTMKENAFVVEQGLPAELAVNIVAPSSVRVGNNTTLNIEYGNNGSTDLNVSGFMVVSANGHPIGLTAADLAEHRDTLTFSTAEPGMDPDIIRPNYFATKTIYVSASSSGIISIYVYPIRRRYE